MTQSTASHWHWCNSCHRKWKHILPALWICRNHRAHRGTSPSAMECVPCSVLPGQTDGGGEPVGKETGPQPPPQPARENEIAGLFLELIRDQLRKL